MATGMLADLSLNQFELLRAFKIRRCQPGADNHSPFVDRVASHYETPPAVDVAQIHETVRQNIIEQIQAVHRQQRSQIVLLAGEAGAGKTHLLRYFARPDLAGKYKYVFVSGSNDWKVEEFQPCVLDWLITALTRPAPTQEHLLLQRIRAIAFRALDQLVANRTVLRRCRAKRRWLGWLLGRRRGSHELIQRLTQARDPRVFEYLDFNEFADEVSLRFLAEPSNPIHRYALRVLLSYVFPDDTPGGLNIRDRVIHWFRRRPDDGYWLRRLGVDENLDRRYVVADAIKLLIHLFSPELSAQLSTERECHEPRIFLLAFDQAEGRQALFDSHEDWKRFFAHLSELYNNLPNLLIIFTMTLQLRHELHDGMERQFRDRIRMDDRFVLMRPEPEQIRELYRARLRHWLKDDVLLQQQYLDLPSSEQYLPFTPESVVQIAGNASLREALENLDRAFAERLRELVIGPNYDFEYVRAEQERLAEEQPDYVNDHLVTVRSLLERLGEELNYHYGLRLEISEHRSEEETFPCLELLFRPSDTNFSSHWVRVYLARLGRNYSEALDYFARKSGGKYSDRKFVWVVRPQRIPANKIPRPEQMFTDVLTPETETRLRAANYLLDHRHKYQQNVNFQYKAAQLLESDQGTYTSSDHNGGWPQAWQLIQREIEQSYLGRLLQQVRERMQHVMRDTSTNDLVNT